MPHSSRRTALSPLHAQQLDHLRKRFETFRQSHSPRSRIPDSLQRAATDLLAAGVTQAQLMQECKLSSSLIHRWRHRKPVQDPARASILTVVDDPNKSIDPRSSVPLLSPARTADLTFKIGGWILRLQIEPSPNEKAF
jgi:hypothetical protein